jgi:hypothetical protein
LEPRNASAQAEKRMSEAITLEQVQALVTRGQYHQCLGHGLYRNNTLIINDVNFGIEALASL